MKFTRRYMVAFILLGAAACGDCPVQDFPVQYQFSTDRSLADRGQLWRHSTHGALKVTPAPPEPFPFQEATIAYLNPDEHHRINRVFDSHIDLTLLDESKCGFDLTTTNHYVTQCTGPQGNFMGMLRVLGRLVDGKFVNDGDRWGWTDLEPTDTNAQLLSPSESY